MNIDKASVIIIVAVIAIFIGVEVFTEYPYCMTTTEQYHNYSYQYVDGECKKVWSDLTQEEYTQRSLKFYGYAWLIMSGLSGVLYGAWKVYGIVHRE